MTSSVVAPLRLFVRAFNVAPSLPVLKIAQSGLLFKSVGEPDVLEGHGLGRSRRTPTNVPRV